MARQKFTHFVPRDKPKKRPGIHKKSDVDELDPDTLVCVVLGQGR